MKAYGSSQWLRGLRGRVVCATAIGLAGLNAPSSAQAQEAPEPKKSAIYVSECRLGTESGVGQQYHALVYYPQEHALRAAGIVIGAEKSSADQVRRGALAAGLLPAPEGVKPNSVTEDWLKGLLQGGSRSVFISHVAASDGLAGQLVFNAYGSKPESDAGSVPAGTESLPWLDCHRDKAPQFDAFGDSWRAIQSAGAQIRKDLKDGDFTHVLIITMGWNTVQTEALQNFASITQRLREVAKVKDRPFRPYVIAFTWPSQWDSPILGSAIVRPASLGVKANDADEFAAGWLGATLRHAVAPALHATRALGKPALKVIGIGHSFGARALSHAVCRGSVLSPVGAAKADPSLPAGFMDTLFNLQGAYSLNRFTAGGAGAPQLAYAQGCPAASRLVFTASKNDSAAELASKLPGPLWAGSLGSWKRMKKTGTAIAPQVDFKLCTAESNGSLKDCSPADPTSRFFYVDASDLIFFESFGTGGGAHSDIYRQPMAEMLWRFMHP